MKRLARNPMRFEPIELFTAVSREHNYKIEAEGDVDSFLAHLGESLKASLKNQTMLNGKRIESLFAHVAGALGHCKLIKKEDSGDIFSDTQDIQAPDYSIVLKDGTRLLVEVKNYHEPNPTKMFSLKRDYVEKLERYASLQDANLKIAIYYSRTNNWTLLSKSSFTRKGNNYLIDIHSAFAKNEMKILGDRLICALPNLEIEFLASNQSEVVELKRFNGGIEFSDMRIFCAGNEVIDPKEKQIALYLIRFGRWKHKGPIMRRNSNQQLLIRYEFSPQGYKEQVTGHKIIGDLSSMVSIAYNEHTVYQKKNSFAGCES